MAENLVGECDFLVIGAGSSGCVVASRLSEDEKTQVVLLEAGGSDRHLMIAMPLVWLKAASMPQFGWGIESAPETQLDGRVQPMPRGKVMGGSSAINGCMYIWGAGADFDEWRDLGLGGWSYDDVLPYFKRLETNWRGAGRDHGGSGPLNIARIEKHPELYPAMIRAAQELGFGEIEDFNVRKPEGFGLPDVNVKDGRRHSVANAYIDPVRNRPNLRVETHALATRILFENKRAVGVEFERDGQRSMVRARREVILSAGVFNSPQLLQLSGIGPARQLAKLGIAPLVVSPRIGSNLQDHPIALGSWKSAKPNTFERELRIDRLIFNFIRWSLTGRGSPSQSPLTVQGFIRSSPAEPRPDLQFMVNHVSYDARPWFPLIAKGAGHVLLSGANLLNPESRGQVSLTSSDAHDRPRVELNFLAEEGDRRRLRYALRFMRRFFSTSALREFVAAELGPGANADSDAALDAWMRATVTSSAHPVGTCAMGIEADAALDAQLRVRGVDRLRVVDCSVMPRIVRGNTNAPAIMIGEKAADMILGRPPLRSY